MKKRQFVVIVITMLLLGYQSAFSQILNIQKLIGKSPEDLINSIGEPVTYDDSNPSEIILTYNLLSLQFLADQKGIFRAELTKNYTSRMEAVDEMNELISNLISEGCLKDSISEYCFNLYGSTVKTKIILPEFDDSPKIELKVIAIRRTE